MNAECGLTGNGAECDDDAEVRKVIAMGIDGHATTRTSLREGYLPFRVDFIGDRLVAFRPDRSDFVLSHHPYLETIDGRDITGNAVNRDRCKGTWTLIINACNHRLWIRRMKGH